jgi:hypothetical protein
MLNLKLRNKLDRPEYRVLYDLGFRLTDGNFKQTIQAAVQSIRKGVTAKGRDPLIWKLEQFGNKGEWAKMKLKELEKIIFDENKRPPDDFKGLYRSIEFEALFTSEQAVSAFTRAVRSKGLSKAVTVKKDDSLRTDEDDKNSLRKEIVITYKAGDEDVVRYVCAAMDSPELRASAGGPRAYVNNTCGTHVHFDMRVVPGATTPQEIEKQVKQYGARLARCVPALKMILPKSRRQNQFCLNAINDMGRPEQKDAGGHHIDKERYAFINLKSYRRHETIEVRGHSGTLNADKILNWIALCDKIMTTRIRFKSESHEIRNPLDLIKVYKLDKTLTAYIEDRFVKFNTAREREMFAVPAPRDAQAAAAVPWAAIAVAAHVAQPGPDEAF